MSEFGKSKEAQICRMGSSCLQTIKCILLSIRTAAAPKQHSTLCFRGYRKRLSDRGAESEVTNEASFRKMYAAHKKG